MSRSNGTSLPVLGMVLDMVAILGNFLSGFLLGLVAPVAAFAAIVAGIRFLTGQVPFLGGFSVDEQGGRQLSLRLMSPDQAKEAFDQHKDEIGGDLAWMKEEIRAIIQEAKSETEAAHAGGEQ